MSTLVIVESPAKAKTIGAFLGRGFTVESSFGHIRDLPKSRMGVDIEGQTFLPDYIVPRDKSAHVKKLKALAKKSQKVIFATDEDREGEAISWHLAEVFGLDPSTAERMVFHEITKTAIDAALKNPRALNIPLVDAQQARRIVDRLVGYELSPLLWKKVARGLSAGRVQSVAVRLIVEREREIKAFVPQIYFTITGIFGESDPNISANLHAINKTTIKKLDLNDKTAVEKIVAELKPANYKIADVVGKEAKRPPLPPFITSTLQQNANQKLGYSAKQTMRLAQQLYEGMEIGAHGSVGLITYMRTDSTNLSETFTTAAKETITNKFGKDYALSAPRRFSTKSKGAQEAHEAIRPTDASRSPEMLAPFLSSQQLSLYTLIWKRALASQMAEARLNRTTIDIETTVNAKLYTLRATGQTIIFAGWLALYPETQKEALLPTVKIGEKIICQSLTSEEHTTEPPARYSDATLVKVLEEHGIGRPSTYAPTIATIEDRHYVERDEQKRLYPTDVAFVVNDLLVENFPSIVDYKFTAQMETDLDAIAEGEKPWQPVIKEFYNPFHALIEKATNTLSKAETTGARELGTDPESGKPISVKLGRFGPYVQKGEKTDEEKPTFASIPKNLKSDDITLDQALTLLSLPKTLGQNSAGENILVGIGKFGPYLKIGAAYVSLKTDNPYTIDLPRALIVIQEDADKKASAILKTFPDSNIIVKLGRYGAYITDGEKNAKIPKGTEPTDLDFATCAALIAAAVKKPKRAWRGKKKT